VCVCLLGCRCEAAFSTGNCETGTGRCICRPEYAGVNCDRSHTHLCHLAHLAAAICSAAVSYSVTHTHPFNGPSSGTTQVSWYQPVKTEWWGAGMVICLERGADLHMFQLMPVPLTVSCFSKIQIGFTFLVPGYPGSPRQRAVKRVFVS